jgi:hypothetical protein
MPAIELLGVRSACPNQTVFWDLLAPHVCDEGIAQLVVQRQPVGARELAVSVLQRDVAARGQLVRAPVVGDLVGEQDFAIEADLDVAARDDEVAPAVLHQLVHRDLELAALGRGRDMSGKHKNKAQRSECIHWGGQHLKSRSRRKGLLRGYCART